MFVASLPEVFLCVNSLTVKLTSCQEKRKKSAFLCVPGAQCQCCQNKSFMLLCQGQVSHSAPIRCSYMHAEGAGRAGPGRVGPGRAGPGRVSSTLLCGSKRHHRLCRGRDRRTGLSLLHGYMRERWHAIAAVLCRIGEPWNERTFPYLLKRPHKSHPLCLRRIRRII